MEKGFNSEVFDSQKVFRKVLNAMASPGTIMEIDLEIDLSWSESLESASAAILLTMLDFETPFWSDLDNQSKDVQWIKFHTGAPYTHKKETALFALDSDSKNFEELQLFNRGSIESPHDSTTLMIQTKKNDKKRKIRLTGPGIKTETFLELSGIKDSFLDKRSQMYEDYRRVKRAEKLNILPRIRSLSFPTVTMLNLRDLYNI